MNPIYAVSGNAALFVIVTLWFGVAPAQMEDSTPSLWSNPIAKAVLGSPEEVWAAIESGQERRDRSGLGGIVHSVEIGVTANGDSVRFAAVLVIPQYRDGADGWVSTILAAVVKQHGDKVARISSLDIVSNVVCGGYFEIKGLTTRTVNGRTMALLCFSYGDSPSTPRGWHTETALIAFTSEWQPLIAWSGETEYHFSGASQPPTDEHTDIEFKDVNGDGIVELLTKTTRVEEHGYTWTGKAFEQKAWPPAPVERPTASK